MPTLSGTIILSGKLFAIIIYFKIFFTQFCSPTVLFAEEFSKTVHLTHPKRKAFAYRLVKATGQLNCTGWQPVCHAEDIFYLFVIPALSKDLQLMKLSHDMIHAWTHFAKHGTPGKMGDVHWTEAFERTQTVTTTYMSLDPADYQMVS